MKFAHFVHNSSAFANLAVATSQTLRRQETHNRPVAKSSIREHLTSSYQLAEIGT